MKYITAAYVKLLVCTLGWCGAFIVPPLIAFSGSIPTVAGFFYSFFSLICHQYDTHSLHVFGYKLAVCARCSAIYFGFLFGVLVFPFFRFKETEHQRTVWIIAVTPMLIDVGLSFIGVHESDPLTRLVSGSFFGVVAAKMLVPLLIPFLTTKKFSINFYEVLCEPKT